MKTKPRAPIGDLFQAPASRLTELMQTARMEDAEHLAGKSDGFVIGWCKVKFRHLGLKK